jgi:hypothetical protein
MKKDCQFLCLRIHTAVYLLRRTYLIRARLKVGEDSTNIDFNVICRTHVFYIIFDVNIECKRTL